MILLLGCSPLVVLFPGGLEDTSDTGAPWAWGDELTLDDADEVLEAAGRIEELLAADLDGDGLRELVALVDEGAGSVTAWGDEVTELRGTASLPLDGVAWLGDVDADGLDDLAVDAGTSHVLWRGAEADTSRTADDLTRVLAGLVAESTAVGDVDGDGQGDWGLISEQGWLAVQVGGDGGQLPDDASVWVTDARGLRAWETSGDRQLVGCADDGSGWGLVASAWDQPLREAASVWHDTPDGCVEVLAEGDLNADGVLDLVVDLEQAGLSIWFSAEEEGAQIEPDGVARSPVLLGDLDGNGVVDLGWLGPDEAGDELLWIVQGDGAWPEVVGTASASVRVSADGGLGSVVGAGDLDGDGRDDLVVLGDELRVLLGGDWLERTDLGDADLVVAAAGTALIEDLDGDGLDDLAVGSGTRVGIFRGR